MFPDKRWEKDARKLTRSLKVSQMLWPLFPEYFEHRIARDVLFSAAMMRKRMEDERDPAKAAVLTEPCSNIELTLLKFTGNEPVIQKITEGDYQVDQGKCAFKKLKELCNWIIHSYVWCVTNRGGGFLLSSDKDKGQCIYFVSLDEYRRAVERCFFR